MKFKMTSSRNFYSQFESLMNSTILEFCGSIATKYNGQMTKEDLYAIWTSPTSSPSKTPPCVPDKALEITREKITNLTTSKELLISMCKVKGLKVTGRKEELVTRLLECIKSSSESPTSSVVVSSSKVKKEEPQVIKSIRAGSVEIPPIKKNSFGNYEHLETRLVLNKEKIVYGVQNSDGTVAGLTDKDIETCKQYKLAYKVPNNLNTNKGSDDLKIEELDGDEEELDDDNEEELEEDDLEEEEILED
jgi:hypothetical protein